MHWCQQQSTGLLHFRSSSPAPTLKRKYPTTDVVRYFLAGALGLEPKAYGFGDDADKSASKRFPFEVDFLTLQNETSTNSHANLLKTNQIARSYPKALTLEKNPPEASTIWRITTPLEFLKLSGGGIISPVQ